MRRLGGVLAVVALAMAGFGAARPSPPAPSPPSPAPAPARVAAPATALSVTAPLPVPDSDYAIPVGALYVSSASGDDGGTGTLTAPFATIGHAVAVAPPGATIVVRAGVYRETLGMLSKPITIQPYPHEQVWLSGSVEVDGWTQDLTDRPDGGAWVHTGWTTQLCETCFDPTTIDPNHPNAGLPDMVFVNGQPLAQVTSLTAVTPGTFYVDTANESLDIGDDPTPAGTVVEAATHTLAMQFNATAAGSVVQGIGIEEYAASALAWPDPAMVVVAGAGGVHFDRDVFARSASRGLTIEAPDATVTNSEIVDNGYTGLHAHHADGIDIEGDVIAANNAEGFFSGFSPTASAAGMKLTSTRGAIVRNDVVQDNAANGIWFDLSSYEVTIVDNVVQRNVRNGIDVEISGAAIVASNVAVDNGHAGIKLSGATDARVYNNTVANNATAQIDVEDDGRVDPNPDMSALGVTWITAGNVLANNILVAPAAGATTPLLVTVDLDSPKLYDASTMITSMDANVYARPDAGAPSAIVSWAHLDPTPADAFTDLAVMQAATGDDATGLEFDGFTTSPIFTDPSAGNFTLLAGSAAIASGVALPSDVAAAIGVDATPAPDRGALVHPSTH